MLWSIMEISNWFYMPSLSDDSLFIFCIMLYVYSCLYLCLMYVKKMNQIKLINYISSVSLSFHPFPAEVTFFEDVSSEQASILNVTHI